MYVGISLGVASAAIGGQKIEDALQTVPRGSSPAVVSLKRSLIRFSYYRPVYVIYSLKSMAQIR
jgi:hypothetical protein